MKPLRGRVYDKRYDCAIQKRGKCLPDTESCVNSHLEADNYDNAKSG
jgi:hypothetical protein